MVPTVTKGARILRWLNGKVRMQVMPRVVIDSKVNVVMLVKILC